MGINDDTDMIEINLTTRSSSEMAKSPPETENNYLGNLRFIRNNTKGKSKGFSYDQQKNDDPTEVTARSHRKSSSHFGNCCGSNLEEKSSDRWTNLRQMYCPDCQQRLDEDSVRSERGHLWSCCLPHFPLKGIFQHNGRRKIVCSKCGSNLGYTKGR